MYTEDLQFIVENKDTSKSCVFDFPDRPIDSLPPNYPPGTPPPGFPYEPTLDWPFIPPEERPVVPPPPEVPDMTGVTFQSHQRVIFEAVDGSGFFDMNPVSNLVIDTDVGSGPGTGELEVIIPFANKNIVHGLLPATNAGIPRFETGIILSYGSDQPIFDNNLQQHFIFFSYYARYSDGINPPENLLTDNVGAIIPLTSTPLLFIGMANFTYSADGSNSPPPFGPIVTYLTALLWVKDGFQNASVTIDQ